MTLGLGGGKVRPEDIEKLEKKCQRMIFEKEDKYIENETALKRDDDEILELELELRQFETKMKEKTQESNLADFKLREMARANDMELGFIKPHAGIHSGILSTTAGEALGQPIAFANQSTYKRSPHMNFVS